MTSHLERRQNLLRGMDIAEVEACLASLVSEFGIEWLGEVADQPLQKLWQRRDGLATNQLVWFGDALRIMRAADPNWTRREVAKIKAGDINNRKGAAFEILGLAMLSKSQRVTPAGTNNPGYDALVEFPDARRMALSLKNYGSSVHEQAVVSRGEQLEQILTAYLESSRQNGVDVRIIAKAHPSFSDWEQLRQGLPEIVAKDPKTPGHGFQSDKWTIIVKPLAEFDARASDQLSYQITLVTPTHANEQQNLFSKLDEAAANAKAHARADDECRAVLVHLPENASVSACEGWARAYFDSHQETPIGIVYFYQAADAHFGESGSSGITHVIAAVEGPSHDKWARDENGRKRLAFEVLVGTVVARPTRRVLIDDNGGEFPIPDCYLFQRGHLHKYFELSTGGVMNMTVSSPAPGLHQHAVGPGAFAVSGIFPPTTELLVFT